MEYYGSLLAGGEASGSEFSSVSGDKISISGAANGNALGLGVLGASEQVTYSGANILNAMLNTTTDGGITCTKKSNNIYELSGSTASDTAATFFLGSLKLENGTYKVTGCPTGGASLTYRIRVLRDGNFVCEDFGEGSNFNVTESQTSSLFQFYILIGKEVNTNGLVFKPMVSTNLELTSDDFEPYVGGVESPNMEYPQVSVSVGSSATNVLDCSSLVETEMNGVKFTPVSDENGLLYVRADGTATENCYYSIKSGLTLSGKYKLVGTPAGSSDPTYSMYVQVGSDYIFDYGTGAYFEDVSGADVFIHIKKDITVSNLRFYPMIVKQDAPDVGYVQYGKTAIGVETRGFNIWDEVLELGDIDDVTGKNTVNNNQLRTKNYTRVFEGDVLYFNFANLTSGGTPIWFYDKSKNVIIRALVTGCGSVTVPKGAYYMRFRTSGTYIVNFGTVYKGNICVNLSGKDNGKYLPSRISRTVLHLDSPLRSIGDVHDEVTVKDGKLGVLRRIGSCIWDYDYASENCIFSAEYACLYRVAWASEANAFVPVKDSDYAGLRCSHFVEKTREFWDNEPVKGALSYIVQNPVSRGNKALHLVSNKFASKDEWLVWFADKDVEIEYLLATEYFEPFEDQSVLNGIKTFDEDMYAFNDYDAEMSIEYPTSVVQGVLSEVSAGIEVLDKEIKDCVSDEWGSKVAYEVNQYCIYNNVLWKCLAANTGVTPVEGVHWTRVSVGDELAELRAGSSGGASGVDGEIKSVYNDKSLTPVANSLNLLSSIDLTEGTWILFGTIRRSSGSGGSIEAYLRLKGSSERWGYNKLQSGQVVYISNIVKVEKGATEKAELQVYVNSVSAEDSLSNYGIKAVRIA